MATCLFCEIAAGRIPCRKAFEDDDLLAFHDINPQAPTHLLLIPKRHIDSPAALTESDTALIGRLMVAAARLADELGVTAGGYRWVINCGAQAGQSVLHLHLHLLGGRRLAWPPG